MTVLYAGLLTWIVTLIVTSSYLFSGVRERAARINRHLGYLLSCSLCFGTWVGLALGFVVTGPLPHAVLNGLLYQAVGFGIGSVAETLAAGREH